MSESKSKPVICKNDGKLHVCEYCNQTFTDRSNKHRHQKFRCPDNPHKSDIELKISDKNNGTIIKSFMSILAKNISDQNTKIEKLTEIAEHKWFST